MKNRANAIYKIGAMVSVASFIPLNIVAGSFPVCTNNKISLPGQNGVEIWSCVGSTESVPVSSAAAELNESQHNLESGSVSPASASVEKRTQASSDSMRNEIERVLGESAGAVKTKRNMNYSVGLQYSTNRKARSLSESRGRSVVVPLSVGFNVTDRTRMSVSVPVINKQSELVGSSAVYNSDAFGVGDISVNATSQLLNETDSRPGLSVSVGVGAPTGKNENPQSDKLSLGSGFWSVSTGATVSKRFDPATLFGSVRYQHVIADEQFGREVQPGSSLEYSYGLGFSLNSALSVSGHFAGAIHRNSSVDGRVIAGSNSEPLEFVTSSSLRLSKRSRLESNLAFGLNKDASDARVGLTLTRDF